MANTSMFHTAFRLGAFVLMFDSVLGRLQGFTPREDFNDRELLFLHQHIPMESRIVGGNRADPGEYPYFVAWNGCGASLIHEDIVLTAAHCNGIGSDSVRIGPSRQFFSGDRNNILDRVPHPFYDPETLSNDFMIMKLATRVENVQPVRLESSMTDEERDLKVMGFGATFEGGFGSFFLQEVGVRQISHPTCNEKYDGDILKESMLCAGQDGGGQDSCQGDSGGPLVIQKDGIDMQVGVVSWGRGCARPDYPGVYSRISSVIEWIEQQICELSSNPPPTCLDSSSTETNPAPAPTPTESTTETEPGDPATACEDSASIFPTDEIYGDRDCNWLSINNNYDYLCRFVDVAVKCPVTCGICAFLKE